MSNSEQLTKSMLIDLRSSRTRNDSAIMNLCGYPLLNLSVKHYLVRKHLTFITQIINAQYAKRVELERKTEKFLREVSSGVRRTRRHFVLEQTAQMKSEVVQHGSRLNDRFIAPKN